MVDRDPKQVDPRELGVDLPQLTFKDEKRLLGSDPVTINQRILNQKKGLRKVGEYLSGKSFDHLNPFIIDAYPTGKSKSNSYFLTTIQGKDVYATLTSQMVETLKSGKSIMVIPGQDENKYYQWLDFYSIDQDVVDTNQILGSYRLDKENRRVVSRGWYGPSQQLFLDFITGTRALLPSELKPFTVPFSRFQTVTFGYRNEKPIEIKIVDVKPEEVQQVTIIPKFDDKRGYVWIEGYIDQGGGQEMVCTKRINPGIPSFDESSWKGPQAQAMIDWIKGKFPIELAEPLKYTTNGMPRWTSLETTSKSQIAFDFQANPLLEGAEGIKLIPRQDELYKWIEVYRDDEVSGGSSRLVSYYRVHQEKRNKLQSSWIGPDRQRYFDYLDGKIDFHNLKEIILPIQSHATVSLFTFKGKHLGIQLNDRNTFPEGEKVKITPSLSIAGDLIVEVARIGIVRNARRFVYDKQTNSFRVIDEENKLTSKPVGYWTSENIEREVKAFYEQEGSLGFLKKQRNDLYIALRKYPGGIEALERKLGIESLPRIDRKSGIYTDKEGRVWAHAYYLGQELGFTPARAYQILRESGLPSILGRSIGEVLLYEVEDARRVLLESGYLERKATPNIAHVTLEETIRNLDPLNPQVIRDKGGRIRWTYPGNSEEQNQALSVNNIHALFFQSFPEFNELFKRQAAGEIDPELVSTAKAFIEDKIGTPDKFRDAMGIVSDSLRSLPYFKAGLPDILKTSFAVLGIEFGEEEKSIFIKDINGQDAIETVDQFHGIKRLKSFMTGQNQYMDVKPFVLDGISGSEERGYHLTIYTYGGRTKNGTVTLTLNNEMKKLAIERKTMICIPKQDSNNLYQWLDFFEILEDNTFDSTGPIGSYRINASDQRLETLGWYGPEIQTFLDYLAQKIDIDPRKLSGFEARLKQTGEGRFYATIGKVGTKHIRFEVTNTVNVPLAVGNEIKLNPVLDPERGYSWLEGYIKDQNGDDVLVGSKRFTRVEVGIYEWKGPEVQSMIDWINGSLPIERASSARMVLDNKSLLLCLLATQQNKIMIQFGGNKNLRRGDILQVVPHSDGQYDWLDIFRIDKGTNQPNILITRALVTRENKFKLQGGWVGSEKQRQKDGTANTSISFEDADEELGRLIK